MESDTFSYDSSSPIFNDRIQYPAAYEIETDNEE